MTSKRARILSLPLSLALMFSIPSAQAAITVSASSHDGNHPINTIDGSLEPSSRWSANGDGQWIRYDLGALHTVKALEIAFQRGDLRVAYFDIQISSDAKRWTTVKEGLQSSGRTTGFQKFWIPASQARYVRILGHGNSANTWNSLTEVKLQLGGAVTPPPDNGNHWWKPGVRTSWQWQLSGSVNTGYNVQMYDIDLYDSSTSLIRNLQQSGRKVLCYFSAGSYEDWRSDKNAFRPADLGKPLDGWAGERWLDVRSSNVRSIMKKRMELAKSKGCNGVEPDNIDGYTNGTGFPLTYADQINYNRYLASTAHSLGLAIALKNDVEQVRDLVKDFDMAVNEQCHQYNECEALKPFIAAGKPVFNAEYGSKYVNDPAARNAMCTRSKALGMHTLVLPLNLDDSFRLDCGL